MSAADVLRLNIRTTAEGDNRIEAIRKATEDLLAALGEHTPLVVRKVAIKCDLCDAIGPTAKTMAAALDAATAFGWTHTTDGSDYCPEED